MNAQDQTYHRLREQHCRAMAELASDPEIRRRHQQLASLHASQIDREGHRNSAPTG
jgi:hypothetical protein